MSSTWLQWVILSGLTGSPVGSAIFLLVFWFVVDRFTLGFLPDPLRWLMRRRRVSQLERALVVNPHDGRASLELASHYVERKRFPEAVELLKRNLARGDDDPAVLFTAGVACLGAGYAEQGEKLLASVEEAAPGFRVHEVDLVRGRFRLARKDFAGARDALERFVKGRSGTVEGRYLLAVALEGLGDDGTAALMKDAAWHEYVHAPRFQRRQERPFAWRARPSRPVAYALLLGAGLAVFALVVVPRLNAWRADVERQQVFGASDPGLDE